MIHTGDCIEVMRGMEADSVDAVCTDPPYGLEFMGKGWDAFRPAVANRGGRAPGRSKRDDSKLAPVEYGIGGRRSTMVCDLCGKRDKFTNPHDCEDATWSRLFLDDDPRHAAYGQSFQAWCEAWGREALRVTKPGGYLLAFGGTRTHHRLVCGLEDAGWIIRDELDWIYASGFPKGKANLKPAHEPIVLARKPGPLQPLQIDATRIGMSEGDAANINSKHAGMDVEAYERAAGTSLQLSADPMPLKAAEAHPQGRWPSNVLLGSPELFDEPNPYVVGSGATSTTGGRDLEAGDLLARGWRDMEGRTDDHRRATAYHREGDSGGYSRFFRIPERNNDDDRGMAGQSGVVAASGAVDGGAIRDGGGVPDGRNYPSAFLIPKAARHDREPAVLPDEHDRSKRFSTHPTVKPTDLMRHLVRLVTPPGGTVLDPFLGSGSTAIACELEGFPWIGIEKEPEYVAIAEARLNGTQRGLGLDVPAPTKAPPKTHPDLSKHQPKRRNKSQVSFSGGWSGTDVEQTPPPHNHDEFGCDERCPNFQHLLARADEEPAA